MISEKKLRKIIGEKIKKNKKFKLSVDEKISLCESHMKIKTFLPSDLVKEIFLSKVNRAKLFEQNNPEEKEEEEKNEEESYNKYGNISDVDAMLMDLYPEPTIIQKAQGAIESKPEKEKEKEKKEEEEVFMDLDIGSGEEETAAEREKEKKEKEKKKEKKKEKEKEKEKEKKDPKKLNNVISAYTKIESAFGKQVPNLISLLIEIGCWHSLKYNIQAIYNNYQPIKSSFKDGGTVFKKIKDANLTKPEKIALINFINYSYYKYKESFSFDDNTSVLKDYSVDAGDAGNVKVTNDHRTIKGEIVLLRSSTLAKSDTHSEIVKLLKEKEENIAMFDCSNLKFSGSRKIKDSYLKIVDSVIKNKMGGSEQKKDGSDYANYGELDRIKIKDGVTKRDFKIDVIQIRNIFNNA